MSKTIVDQSFEEVLPWSEFSYRLYQKDIPHLPRLLSEFPDERWRQLRQNLACAWPRVLWLNPDNEAPGFQTDAEAKLTDATSVLGDQAYLSGYDALESIAHTLGRRTIRRRGLEPPPFEWRTPARSCAQVNGMPLETIRATPPISQLPNPTPQ